MIKLIATACLFLLAAAPTQGREPPREVKLEVLVIGEDGNAIKGVVVDVGFPARIARDDKYVTKTTDKDGRASFSGSSHFKLRIISEKEGFYTSRLDVTTFTRVDQKNVYSDQRVTVVMREIKNPVAMYAYRIDTKMYDTKNPKGYDLLINDWVAPWGKGEISDIEFMITGFYEDYNKYDSTLRINFPNEGDGLIAFVVDQQSELKSPYTAFADGYVPVESWRKTRVPVINNSGNEESIDETKRKGNYVFRIRTKFKESGEVISALYGKMYGGFEFGGATESNSYLRSGYIYINPTQNDTNIECDPKHYIMPNIESWNRPNEP